MTDTPAAAGTPKYRADVIVERYLELCDKQLGGAGVNYGTAEDEERDLILPIRAIEDELSACRAELAAAREAKRPFTTGNEVIAGQVAEIDRLTALVKTERLAKEESERLLAAVWDSCTVIYWPKDGSYPLEHVMAAGKDSRLLILAALASKEPPK